MSAEFDPSIPLTLLRLMCGLFLIPHILGKVLPPHPALNFFKAAQLPAPAATMALAAVVETLVCIGLVFGIQTRWAAWIGAALLAVAAWAVWRLQGMLGKPRWLWNLGGREYPVFWMLACVVVALASPA